MVNTYKFTLPTYIHIIIYRTYIGTYFAYYFIGFIKVVYQILNFFYYNSKHNNIFNKLTKSLSNVKFEEQFCNISFLANFVPYIEEQFFRYVLLLLLLQIDFNECLSRNHIHYS